MGCSSSSKETGGEGHGRIMSKGRARNTYTYHGTANRSFLHQDTHSKAICKGGKPAWAMMPVSTDAAVLHGAVQVLPCSAPCR